MRQSAKLHEWCIALGLTLTLHLLVIVLALLPLGNYFFPFIAGAERGLAAGPADAAAGPGGEGAPPVSVASAGRWRPLSLTAPLAGGVAHPTPAPAGRPLTSLLPAEGEKLPSLARTIAAGPLRTPQFSARTIPPKPAREMWEEIADNAQEILTSDVVAEAVPAQTSRAELAAAEAAFLTLLRADILDGRLDMPFAEFIIQAEYYHLSHALLDRGLQPAFSLAEATERYRQELARVGAGLSGPLNAFSLVMVLQRYAEYKYYPGNGSGMLLDALFHNLNDCESGTKEVLAYLQDLYPELRLGSNRGLVPTTTGEVIGHMQVYLAADELTRGVLANDHGLVVETTRVGQDSVLPYRSGEIFPLEDFVFRYYPAVIVGTPLEALYQGDGEAADGLNIVGTSDHPLKMGYGGTATFLSEQLFDLDNIRTRKIENEFLTSSIPGCDPRIDPLDVDRSNIFSTLVGIEPNLRRSLVGHYLSGLAYRDNQVMPHWRAPWFVAGYRELAATLLSDGGGDFIQIDAEETLARAALAGHRDFLRHLRQGDQPPAGPYLGQGGRQCREPALLDEGLLRYLFAGPEEAGLFFLPAPGGDFSWPGFSAAILADCLRLPEGDGAARLLADLQAAAAESRLSLRGALWQQARQRGANGEEGAAADRLLADNSAALRAIFTGAAAPALSTPANPSTISAATAPSVAATAAVLAGRASAASDQGEASVAETVAELGRTGVNSGLIWDAFDFLGPQATAELLRLYAGRSDLRLTLPRAIQLALTVAQLAEERLVDGDAALALIDSLVDAEAGSDGDLQLAAYLGRARLQGLPPVELSAGLVTRLLRRPLYRHADLQLLLAYGLRREDAPMVFRPRLEAALASLPGPNDGAVPAGPFVELAELLQSLDAFQDSAGHHLLRRGLGASLVEDFGQAMATTAGASLDYGLLFNKLYLLALLPRQPAVAGSDKEGERLLAAYLDFAGSRPVGKAMLELVEASFSAEGLERALAATLAGQQAELSALLATADPLDTAVPLDTADHLAEAALPKLLGAANVASRLLDRLAPSRLTHPGGSSGSSGLSDQAAAVEAGRGYLEKLHRQLATSLTAALPATATTLATPAGEGDSGRFSAPFYRDPRLREAFSLLAGRVGNEWQEKIKFRKTRDLRTITDPSTIKVVEAGRQVTRQDMSLLTLALHPDNRPTDLRRAWEETLAVTAGHLARQPMPAELRDYLFAPHHPYLVENDFGFFYPPETVADFHNAAGWGGRNDILLTSYLHFRHLPEELPEWLLQTALGRSQFELDIIRKFAEQTFLPMILECTGDHDEMPAALFRAKWQSRKPFGEDIFPATLLLLRLGYLEVNSAGEIVPTPKLANR